MKKWLVRISLGLVALTLVGAVSTWFVIEDSLDKMYGADTAVAGPELSPASPERYWLDNVSVLAPTGDAFVPRQSILVENGIIRAVTDRIEDHGELPVVDGGGLYAIPGYTDSHVHLWNSPNDLLLYLANGVTQVREMHGRPHHLAWREEIEAGRPGPDLYVVAAQLATYGFWEGIWTGWLSKRNVVRSPDATGRMIRSLDQESYDAIKASSFLSRENYQAASAATRKAGIPLVGHLPVAADLSDLWSSNQTEVAHVEELVKALDREFGGYGSSDAQAFLAHVRARRSEVARQLAERDITVASTLALIDTFRHQSVDLERVLADVELDYVNPGVAEGQAMGWLPEVNQYRAPERARTNDWRERYSTYWGAYADAQQLMFEALLDAEVTIVAATDANVPVMVPGFSMHREMAALHAAGMTPKQVIASATSEPAKWMGWNTGEISEGFRANIVLLRENPLDDIDATDAIEVVIKDGRVYSRSDLDAMVEAVEAANDASRKTAIDGFTGVGEED